MTMRLLVSVALLLASVFVFGNASPLPKNSVDSSQSASSGESNESNSDSQDNSESNEVVAADYEIVKTEYTHETSDPKESEVHKIAKRSPNIPDVDLPENSREITTTPCPCKNVLHYLSKRSKRSNDKDNSSHGHSSEEGHHNKDSGRQPRGIEDTEGIASSINSKDLEYFYGQDVFVEEYDDQATENGEEEEEERRKRSAEDSKDSNSNSDEDSKEKKKQNQAGAQENKGNTEIKAKENEQKPEEIAAAGGANAIEEGGQPQAK